MGPTSRTVTPTIDPFWSKTEVMPTLRPIRLSTLIAVTRSPFAAPRGRPGTSASAGHAPAKRPAIFFGHTDWPRLREAGFTGVVYDIATNPARGAAGRVRATQDNVERIQKLVATEPMSALKDKHLYTVTVDLSEPYTLPPLPNVTVVAKAERSAVLKASGDIGPLLTALAGAPVHDVVIQHATLEELFLEHYERA